jgi:hypothetical protein
LGRKHKLIYGTFYLREVQSLDFGFWILDFGLTSPSSVELENFGFGIYDFAVLQDGEPIPSFF